MTSYTLSIGYLSGCSFKGNDDEAWQALVNCVEALKHDPDRIVAEARRLGAPEQCEHGCCTLRAYAEAYQSQDATLITYPDEKAIRQFASGDRTLKEHVRRAFCRLVMEDMHRQGIEVNLAVS